MKIKKLNFETDKFGRTILEKNIRDLSGIYLLFSGNLELLYIGQTTKFRNRLWSHVSKNNSKRNSNAKAGDWGYTSSLELDSVKYFHFIEIDSRTEKDMVENMLIYALRPKLNRICAKEDALIKCVEARN